jgi:fermentation-respiration switch protein FrsA (DUF1100 family)
VAAVIVVALRWVAVLGLLFLAWECAKGFRGYQTERSDFQSDPSRVVMPADAGSLGLSSVSFNSRDGTAIRGWYIPSKTGAAIVLCHGSAGTRNGMIEDARALAKTGDGILLFDMPGRGESGGVTRFGAPERAALEGAIDYLVGRPDVAEGRIGGVGFSTGAYILSQVASLDQRLRAVVLEGAFGDAIEQTRVFYEGRSIGTQLGGVLAVRVNMDVKHLRPIDVVGNITPRPVVIVAGTNDRTVPAKLSRELYDAARMPKQLWMIEGAGHGQYAAADSTYEARLRTFFEEALGTHANPRGDSTAKNPPIISSTRSTL